MRKIKNLVFRKSDLVNLTSAEQKNVVGGNAGIHFYQASPGINFILSYAGCLTVEQSVCGCPPEPTHQTC